MISNDTTSAVSKFNKCKTCQQKTINSLIIEKYVLVSSYFCTNVSHLLDFDMDDMVSFDKNYFFQIVSPIFLVLVFVTVWFHKVSPVLSESFTVPPYLLCNRNGRGQLGVSPIKFFSCYVAFFFNHFTATGSLSLHSSLFTTSFYLSSTG